MLPENLKQNSIAAAVEAFDAEVTLTDRPQTCQKPEDVEVPGQLPGVPDLAVPGRQRLPAGGAGVDLRQALPTVDVRANPGSP